MLLLRFRSSVTVTSQTGNSSSNSTCSTVGNAATEVVELALGLLRLALSVLLLAGAFEILLQC